MMIFKVLSENNIEKHELLAFTITIRQILSDDLTNQSTIEQLIKQTAIIQFVITLFKVVDEHYDENTN